MRKLVKFRLNRECREIAVNPDKVLWVCHYEHGASTLHFGKDCCVRVQGELEVVMDISGDRPLPVLVGYGRPCWRTALGHQLTREPQMKSMLIAC